jgi:hypothetical protein
MHIAVKILIALVSAMFIELLFDQILIGWHFTRRGALLTLVLSLILLAL